MNPSFLTNSDEHDATRTLRSLLILLDFLNRNELVKSEKENGAWFS